MVLYKGLYDHINDELMGRDYSLALDNLISLATKEETFFSGKVSKKAISVSSFSSKL